MWKKNTSLLFFALLTMLSGAGGLTAQVAAGDIDLQSVSHNVNNPTGICQCDTITVRYEIKSSANFSSTSTFEYQLANPVDDFSSPINLDLTTLYIDFSNRVEASSVLDTFSSGLKWARLAIPCNAPLFGASLRIVNRDFNGNITPGGVSDTAYYNVNRIPTVAAIDSVAMQSSGVVQDTFGNPYTTTVPDDVGICPGDSVYIRADNDGTSYQWYNGSTPLVGEINDELWVSSSGIYYVEVFDGACSIMSDSVEVQIINTPTDITFNPSASQNANAYRADRVAPFDTIELCYTESAMLQGPAPNLATGLTFTYQWLTDSLNSTTGLRDTFEITGATSRHLMLNSSNLNPGSNRFWVVVNDGICSDITAQPYFVIVDTVPNAEVASIPFPGLPGTTEFGEVCMTDSLNLTTVPSIPDPAWKYSWQWYDPSGGGNWRSVSGRPASNLSFDTMPQITIDTSLSDPGQPYFQDPKAPLRFFRVRIHTQTATGQETCEFFTDSIVVRWKPQDSIVYNTSNPNIFQIGHDSIRFCVSESADLIAPATPSALLNNGYSYNYQWLRDTFNTALGRIVQAEIPGETFRTFSVNESGRYSVAIDDGICVDTLRRFHVFVDSIPTAQVVSAPFPGFPGNIETGTVCMMDSVQLMTVPSIPDPTWKYRWQWYDPTGAGTWRSVSGRPSNDLSFDTLARITIDTSLSEPGQPYVQEPKPALRFFRVRISNELATGEETCVYFSDSITIRWKPEDSITYNTSNPNIFQVGRDSISFCATDSAELVASETPPTLVANNYFYDYQWLRDTYDTILGRFVQEEIPGETLRRLTVNESGRYAVVIDDGICTDTIRRFHVFVDSLPSTSLVVSNYPGQSVPSDRNLCLTDSIMLSAQDSILPGWNYQWQFDAGAGWTNATNDTLPWLSVDTAYRPIGVDTVWFRLATSYENRFGLTMCPDTTAPLSVHFFDPPNLSFLPSDSVLLCEGDSVQVIAQGNANTFVWDGTDFGATKWFTQPGIYTVTATGINGCTTTREVQVNLYETTANAGSDITTTSGTTVTLTGSGGDNFRWYADKPIAWSDFLSQSVDVSYELPEGVRRDTVTIYLEVTNDDGCTDTDMLQLIVTSAEDEDAALLERAWNLFTPNDDGMNDVWDISSIVDEYNGCSLSVMNRWGSNVYEEEDFDGIWEGNDSGGNPLPDGTYYYILHCDGEVILKKAVTIIRNNQ